VLAKDTFKHQSNAARDYAHDADREHLAAIPQLDKRMNLAVAWQQVPETATAQYGQSSPEDEKHLAFICFGFDDRT